MTSAKNSTPISITRAQLTIVETVVAWSQEHKRPISEHELALALSRPISEVLRNVDDLRSYGLIVRLHNGDLTYSRRVPALLRQLEEVKP